MYKYYGNFIVNNSTLLKQGLESNNLKELTKKLKSLASGNIFQYGTGRINIWSKETGNTVLILSAKWHKNGLKWFKITY